MKINTEKGYFTLREIKAYLESLEDYDLDMPFKIVNEEKEEIYLLRKIDVYKYEFVI